MIPQRPDAIPTPSLIHSPTRLGLFPSERNGELRSAFGAVVCVLVIIAWLWCLPVPAKAEEPSRKPVPSLPKIQDEELLRLFQKDEPIKNYTVSTFQILDLIQLAAGGSVLGEWIPERMEFEDCVISDGRTVGSGVGGKESWHGVPLPVDFTRCVFTNDIYFRGAWNWRVSFESCVFKGTVYLGIGDPSQFREDRFPDRPFAKIPPTRSVGKGHFVFKDTTFEEGLIEFGIFGSNDNHSGAKLTFTKSRIYDEARFHGIWKEGAEFTGCDFFGSIWFTVEPHKPVFFDNCTFHAKTLFKTRVPLATSLTFRSTKFRQSPRFTGIRMTDQGALEAQECEFAQDAFFNQIEGGNLRLRRSHFSGRSDFTSGKFVQLEATRMDQQGEIGRPCVFVGRPTFHKAQAAVADFDHAEFREYADFSNVKFGTAKFDNAIFEKEADFQLAQFGGVLSLKGARFQDTLLFDLKGRLASKNGPSPAPEDASRLDVDNPRTFENLEAAFARSGDTENKNDAFYRRKLLENPSAFERWFWGYGVRPWRLAGWIVVVYACFTALYVTQVPTVERWWRRLWKAAAFSLRTSWHWNYGPKHSRGWFWKSAATVQMLGFKVMAILLLKAVANTSPLLNDLVSKLYPL
jgi:uncharacterized protein YjbI with pentapeptide repeats